jgi:hypothetical protein
MFRTMKPVQQSTEFYLAVELWLAWLDPARTLKGERGKTWRRLCLRRYVQAHLHFYTTLLVLFLRKVRGAKSPTHPPGLRGAPAYKEVGVPPDHAVVPIRAWCAQVREVLAADPARAEVGLLLVQRVLRLYKDLKPAVEEACGVAERAWAQYRNTRGLPEDLLHHLRLCRLLQSRPCLLSAALPEARHVGDELVLMDQNITVEMNKVKQWYDHPLIQPVAQVCGFHFNRLASESAADQGEQLLTPELELPELRARVRARVLVLWELVEPPLSIVLGQGPLWLKVSGAVSCVVGGVQVEQVRQAVLAVFPGAKREVMATVAQRKDGPERRGLLLTRQGRMDVLMGVAAVDPTKVPYLGDPLFRKELGEYEIGFLIPATQWLSVKLSQYLKGWTPPDPAQVAPAGSTGVRHTVQATPPPAPINLRCLADVRYYSLAVIFLIAAAVMALVFWVLWCMADAMLSV